MDSTLGSVVSIVEQQEKEAATNVVICSKQDYNLLMGGSISIADPNPAFFLRN
jgi:hypothetical protein